MESQMNALNPIDFSTLAAASTGTTRFSDADPAYGNGLVSGKTVRRFIITTETAECRWRADGSPATAGTGMVLAKNDTLSFTGANYKSLINAMTFIATASTCNMSITWFD